MESLLVRKSRYSLTVEPLEDRRLLSNFGPPPGSDYSAFEIANHAEMAPPTRGPLFANGDNSNSPGPGSADAPSRPTAPEPGANSNPSFAANQPTTTTAPVANASSNDCPPSSATQDTIASPPTTQSNPETAQGRDSTANNPTGGESASLAPSIQITDKAVTPSAVSGINSRGPAAEPSIAAFSVNPPALSISRSVSSESIARSVGSVVQTSRVENGDTAHSGNPGHSPADDSTLATVVALPLATGIPLVAFSHGVATAETLAGLGWLIAPARAALDPGVSKEVAETRSIDEAPGISIGQEGAEVRTRVDNFDQPRAGEGIETPDPQLADMIMSFMPFDRSALEGVVDRFLEPLDDIASSIPQLGGYTGLVTASLTLAVTVLTVDLSMRIRRTRANETDIDESGLDGFPGLPGVRRWAGS